MELQTGIPRRVREVRPAARFPHDVAAIIKDLSPRILQVMRRFRCEMSPLFITPSRPRPLQFSGHGDAVKRGPLAGALAFELPDGTINLPGATISPDLT